jgi:glycosyltransferase involved in cell wall biosynthesis
MKIITVSTFWNCGEYVTECIRSLKNQHYTKFVSYFIDDMSTDNSYDIAKKAIGNDERFVLIRNTEKKYKTKNFIDIIKNNSNIKWDDVIIEIDGDDRLKDSFVLGRINKVFSDPNVWICGTRWEDTKGRLGNYGKPNPEKARSSSWNFSHMRSYRAFLFRSIRDEDLKFNGEYYKAACDLGFGIPMLEMSGSEHFVYINEPMYVYVWHDKQSYSNNSSFGDKNIQGRNAKHIYSLPRYEKLLLKYDGEEGYLDEAIVRKNNMEVLGELFNSENKSPIDPDLNKEIDYDILSRILQRKGVYVPKENIKPPLHNLPKERKEIIELKKGSIVKVIKDSMGKTDIKKSDVPNIFSKNKRK